MSRKTLMPAAYGYVRFSSEKQEDGDSVRRQRDGILTWLLRNGHRVQLDTSLGEHSNRGFFVDRGKTGYADTGDERKTLGEDYALGELLRHVDSGRVAAGSFVVVESADRLSRESAVHALHLITGLLKRRLVVVVLNPETELRSDADLFKLFSVGVSSERAHDESRTKSLRYRGVWESKRAGAADQPLTHIVPSWCRLVGARKVNKRLVGGEIRLDPAKANTVRRMFEMARSGIGVRTIANQLQEEGVPVVGQVARWSETIVYHVLTSRAVLGEYHPHTGRNGSKRKGRPQTRTPTGKVVAGYYPRVISDEDFFATQQAIKARAKFRGRRGKHLSLFAGLLADARTGRTFTYRRATGRPATLVPPRVLRDEPWTSFSADVFERAVLSRLAELKPSEVFPDNNLDDEVIQLGKSLAAKEGRIVELREEIGTEPALLRLWKDELVQLDREREELASRLAAAQREAASPLSEVWGEFRGVVELLDRDTSEDTRRRCREALRRLIEKVHCVFAGDRRMQFAAVQVWFTGGSCRNYFIAYEQKRAGGTGKGYTRPARWWVKSFADVELVDGLDLRRPADAAAVIRVLDALDPGVFVPATNAA